MDFTIVLGVDEKHLSQLRMTIATWVKHKPSLFEKRWIVFYDDSVKCKDILELFSTYAIKRYHVLEWPPEGVKYKGDPNSKWTRQQRVKMLSGFIHIAAQHVKTPYWLKIDTDVVASGGPDDWIEEHWFDDDPAIVSQRWSYTKPGNQMMELDKWFDHNYNVITHQEEMYNKNETGPLNLIPNEGSSLVSHKRIISWVGFFNTSFTRFCSKVCEHTCGIGKMPCPSQDGTVFYLAKRGDFGILRVNMKRKGWSQNPNTRKLRSSVDKIME